MCEVSLGGIFKFLGVDEPVGLVKQTFLPWRVSGLLSVGAGKSVLPLNELSVLDRGRSGYPP